jgi:hypothetical protein
MKSKFLLSVAFLLILSCITLTFSGCAVSFSGNNSTANILAISYTAYEDHASSTDEILKFLQQSMAHNETVCHIWVNDVSLINADEWLGLLSGIEQIHCEYRKIADGYNMAVTLQYWDNYPIVYAYQNNDTSCLNEQQLALYHKYCAVLLSYTSSERTACANELSIHDYLVTHTNYVENNDSSYNAYNTLINGQAVCSGYAECFKTFMDMLGIENTTISGIASGQPHIWNEVLLDGDWYQVDVTWDDPVLSSTEDVQNATDTLNTDDFADKATDHAYFNISDTDMSSDHSWDSSQNGFHSATGMKNSYPNIANLKEFSTQAALCSYLEDCIRNKKSYLEFTVTAPLDLKSALSAIPASFSYSYKIAEHATCSLYTMYVTY